MISPVSFTSTYRANNKDNFSHEYLQFRQYAAERENLDGVTVGFEDKNETSYPYNYSSTTTMVVPDTMDKLVEIFCRARGINVSKYKTEDLINPKTIAKRIKPAKRGMQKVNVNVEKLEDLIQNQKGNFNYCENIYENENYFSRKIDYMLKNGNPIQTSTLYITPSSSVKDTVNYINRFGANNLNEGQLFFDFNQTTDDPDHCMYFALRDLGMKNVPVYVNPDTYAIGNALGIFE